MACVRSRERAESSVEQSVTSVTSIVICAHCSFSSSSHPSSLAPLFWFIYFHCRLILWKALILQAKSCAKVMCRASMQQDSLCCTDFMASELRVVFITHSIWKYNSPPALSIYSLLNSSCLTWSFEIELWYSAVGISEKMGMTAAPIQSYWTKRRPTTRWAKRMFIFFL